jgi:hypothetical protein
VPVSLPVADAARLRRRGFELEYATLTWMVAEAAVAITAGLITASTGHSGRAGLVGGDVEAPVWRSIWVAIGQARMGLAARDAGTSYLVLGGLLVSRLLAGRHCM